MTKRTHLVNYFRKWHQKVRFPFLLFKICKTWKLGHKAFSGGHDAWNLAHVQHARKDAPNVVLTCPLHSLWGISYTLLGCKFCLKMFCLTKELTFGSWTIYGPRVISLILANFELVKCCLLYYSEVNKYNQMKAGSLFYSPGKNYWWPVKTVPLKEFSVRSLGRISHLIIRLLITAQFFYFTTIFFSLYIFTKSLKLKNWNKSKIRSSNKFLQLSLSIDQSVCFFNSTSTLSWVTQSIFTRWANLTMASMDPFWHGTNTFVVTSTDSHSSNGKTKFVKGISLKT